MAYKSLLVLLLSLSFKQIAAVEIGSFEVNINNNGVLEGVVPLVEDNKFLNLSSLDIKDIASEALKNVTHIASLDLSNNAQLSNLSSGAVFSTLSSLKTLNLSNSNLTVDQNMTIFKNLPDDTEILVNHLKVNSLRPQMFGVDESLQIESSNASKLNCPKNFSDTYTRLTSQHIIWLYPSSSQEPSIHTCINVTLTEVAVVHDRGADATCVSFNLIRKVLLSNDSIEVYKKFWLGSNNGRVRTVFFRNVTVGINGDVFNVLPETINSVFINDNRINVIKSNVIKNDNVKVLDLYRNHIVTIENEAFKHLSSLVALHLGDNNISDISFVHTLPSTVEHLVLNGNNIEVIPGNSFTRLTKLHKLELDSNRIKSIGAGSFSGLNKLRILYLSNNAIVKIEPGSFDDLTCLRDFYLGNNNLTVVDNGSLKNMNSLTKLCLSANKLDKLEKGAFYGLPLDTQVWVDDNNVTLIQPGVFKKS